MQAKIQFFWCMQGAAGRTARRGAHAARGAAATRRGAAPRAPRRGLAPNPILQIRSGWTWMWMWT